MNSSKELTRVEFQKKRFLVKVKRSLGQKNKKFQISRFIYTEDFHLIKKMQMTKRTN